MVHVQNAVIIPGNCMCRTCDDCRIFRRMHPEFMVRAWNMGLQQHAVKFTRSDLLAVFLIVDPGVHVRSGR